MEHTLDLSSYLDFQEILLNVEKLRAWMEKYAPLTELDQENLNSEIEKKIWSEVSGDDSVNLCAGIFAYAERFFVSGNDLFDESDRIVTTACFFSCPICEETEGESDCICEGNGRLFLDLERLLKTCTTDSINSCIEPAQ